MARLAAAVITYSATTRSSPRATSAARAAWGGRPEDVAHLRRLRQRMEVCRGGGINCSARRMPGGFVRSVPGRAVGVGRGSPLEARTGRALGEDSRGVKSRRRARVIGTGFLGEDECWFGARDGIPGNRPQLLHRQLEVTRACLHLLEFRTKASADPSGTRRTTQMWGCAVLGFPPGKARSWTRYAFGCRWG